MVLAILSGILFTVVFSVGPLWWLAFVALSPLLLSLDRARTWKAVIVRISLFSFFLSSGMGFCVFNALIGHYRLPAVSAVFFFCLALILPIWLVHLPIALFYRFLNNRTLIFYALIAPGLWVLGDYVKSMIPILVPWGDIGYALVHWPAYFQMADLGGVYLVSFFVVMFNALLVRLIHGRFKRSNDSDLQQIEGRAGITAVLLALIISGPLCYGTVRHHQISAANRTSEKERAVIVQGNFSPENRWGGLGFYQRLRTYVALSDLSSVDDQGCVIVWPETVLNHPEALTESFFTDLARMLGEDVCLIAGGLKRDPARQGVYNSVYLINGGHPRGGHLRQRYDKHILLPYSERAPMVGPFFRFYNAPDRFVPGTTPACLTTAHGKVGLSVCFEMLYPGYIHRSVKQGAEFLVNVSNDSWFGDSAMPRCHLQMARARAVETGRWLLRSSNSGISAVIAPDGKITATSDLFCAQRISGPFVRLSGITVYSRWGDWLFFFLLAVLAVNFFGVGFFGDGFLRAGFLRAGIRR